LSRICRSGKSLTLCGRSDWQYALGLELSDPGFHSSVLSAVRRHLVTHEQAQVLLDTLLDHCAANGLLEGKRKQRTDSTHVLAAVRSLSLVALVGETLRRALNALAQVAPAWLQPQLPPAWITRDGRRCDS
jgi:transposase